MKLSCGLLALVLSVRISLAQEARLVIETLPEEVQSFVVSADPSLQFRTTTVDRGRRDADTGVPTTPGLASHCMAGQYTGRVGSPD